MLSSVNDVLTARGVRAAMSVSEAVASLQPYAADGSSATKRPRRTAVSPRLGRRVGMISTQSS